MHWLEQGALFLDRILAVLVIVSAAGVHFVYKRFVVFVKHTVVVCY